VEILSITCACFLINAWQNNVFYSYQSWIYKEKLFAFTDERVTFTNKNIFNLASKANNFKINATAGELKHFHETWIKQPSMCWEGQGPQQGQSIPWWIWWWNAWIHLGLVKAMTTNMYMERCRPLRPRFYDGYHFKVGWQFLKNRVIWIMMVEDDWMMSPTDDAIWRLLKKTLNIGSQTTGWFYPLGRGTQIHQNHSFSTHLCWSGSSRAQPKGAVYKKTKPMTKKRKILFNSIIYPSQER